MTCPRCRGCPCSEWFGLHGWALRCLNCGSRFGESVLDFHHGFSIPPPPHHVETLVYDPLHRRLKMRLNLPEV